jgi:ATP-dependent helicase/nuclease subunit A
MVKAPRIIPDTVRATQARASDPAASAFVSANAGSGKTHVLVQRVIRLLLNDVAPEKILCITFTKAAAANMAERVFSTLGHWVTLDDAALDAAIREAGLCIPRRGFRFGAQLLRPCAGDAGRAESPDHPRAVQRAAAISVRGQCPARSPVLTTATRTRH